MISKFNSFNTKNKINEEITNLPNYDLDGGVSDEDFSDILRKISELYANRSNLTTEEKILTEILFNMLTKPEKGYNYDTYYQRRIGFIENNTNKNK